MTGTAEPTTNTSAAGAPPAEGRRPTEAAGTFATLRSGAEVGLRFACLFDGKGGARELSWAGVRAWRPEDGLLWLHIERDEPEAQGWVLDESGIDPVIAESLLAEDSRPRVEAADDTLLLILRGVNVEDRTSIGLVPLHVWVDRHRAITMRDKGCALSALRDIRLALQAGHGPKHSGALIARIAEKVVRDLQPLLDSMEESIEALEDECMEGGSPQLRRRLGAIRRQAVQLRRYFGPQREALTFLRAEETPLLDKRDRLRLRGVGDLISRHIEDLDSFRDRLTIMHEDMSAVVSEKIARTTHRFSVIAALLLPPSLIAGMLGTNIGGIPGQGTPYAFLVLAALIFAMLFAQILVLRAIKWL